MQSTLIKTPYKLNAKNIIIIKKYIKKYIIRRGGGGGGGGHCLFVFIRKKAQCVNMMFRYAYFAVFGAFHSVYWLQIEINKV